MTTYRLQIEPVGRTIECAGEQTILDACLRNSIWIPHACSRGTCGTCKADLVAGTADMGDDSQTCITKGELRDGKVLLCSAVPTSDAVIEVSAPTERGVRLYPVRDYTGWVTAIEECAQDTRRFFIELHQPLDFVAGQYVTLRVPERNVRRSYSLANPPTDRRRIELHVRREPGGEATDNWLFNNVELGEELNISGPYGSFLLRTDRLEPAIMIAGGTGLAPIKSMIREVLERNHPQQLYLFQGARVKADLYDVDFFEQLASVYPQFTYVPCLSDESWSGAQGLVTDIVTTHFGRARGHVAYVCGPRSMVEEATKALVELRVPSRDIYRETFYDQADRLALSEVGASQIFS